MCNIESIGLAIEQTDGLLFENPALIQETHTPYNAELLKVIGLLSGASNIIAYLPDGTVCSGWFRRKTA